MSRWSSGSKSLLLELLFTASKPLCPKSSFLPWIKTSRLPSGLKVCTIPSKFAFNGFVVNPYRHFLHSNTTSSTFNLQIFFHARLYHPSYHLFSSDQLLSGSTSIGAIQARVETDTTAVQFPNMEITASHEGFESRPIRIRDMMRPQT